MQFIPPLISWFETRVYRNVLQFSYLNLIQRVIEFIYLDIRELTDENSCCLENIRLILNFTK